MIAPALSIAEASTLLESRKVGYQYEPHIHDVGTGSREPLATAIKETARQLRKLQQKYESRTDVAARLEFDAEAAPLIHGQLEVGDRLVAEDDFWRYLACVSVPDVVSWRHAGKDGDTAHVYYGLGDKWECLPKHLWLRAQLSLTANGQDPYELTRRGGRDFWSSGVIRILHGSSRPIVRALVRFQYREPGRFMGQQYRPQTLSLKGIRELYKRLRHFNSLVAFPILTDDEADDLVVSLATDLPRQKS
jgi:hypothetical protein